MQVYLLDLNASYVVVFTAPQTGWNILLRMSFHNIQRPVPIFDHGRDPLSSWQKFLIQFNHLWSSSKMEQGTNLSFLASHRPFSSLSLSREPQKHPQVDTTARTSISNTGTCFMVPLVRIYVLWGGVSSLSPVCLLSPKSKWTGHLDIKHGKGGN